MPRAPQAYGPHTPEDYEPETLLKWKNNREADGEEALVGLTRLTEDGLENILVEAFQAKQDQIIKILERLEQNNEEAAGLLKEMNWGTISYFVHIAHFSTQTRRADYITLLRI
ncbi:MAG: hypothetical protein ACRDQY_07465 [Pseudonocardiaceae bacterium]